MQCHKDKDQPEIRIRRGGRKKDSNNGVSFSSAYTSYPSHHTTQPSLELGQELQRKRMALQVYQDQTQYGFGRNAKRP